MLAQPLDDVWGIPICPVQLFLSSKEKCLSESLGFRNRLLPITNGLMFTLKTLKTFARFKNHLETFNFILWSDLRNTRRELEKQKYLLAIHCSSTEEEMQNR